MKKLIARMVATCIIGYMPFAPGTWGSALALGVGYCIVDRYGWFEMALAFGAVCLIGLITTRWYLYAMPDRKDPKEVVIDEVAGQWLTLLTPILLLHLGAWLQTGILSVIALEKHWVAIYFTLGFIFFRLFDILKPWPVSFFDRKVKGAWGVMLDDIAAGLMAGVLLYVIYIIGPIVLSDTDSNLY